MNKHTPGPIYRRWNSYGFLKLFRIDPDGNQTCIASTAALGDEGPRILDQAEAKDRAAIAKAEGREVTR